MRKIALIGILLLFITTDTEIGSIQSDELNNLASAVSDSGLTIDEWEVTLKETMDRDQLKKIMDELKNSHIVTVTESEKSINYLFESTPKREGISESYNVIIPHDDMYHAELIAVVDGTNWNPSMKENYHVIVNSMKEKYFTDSAELFACLTTKNGDILESDSILNDLADRLSLQYMETQIDTINNSMHEKIIYGYTPLWSQKIMIEEIPMNVQIAVVENENGNHTYTIGTPMLINEY